MFWQEGMEIERHECVSFPVVKVQKIFSNSMTTGKKCLLNFRFPRNTPDPYLGVLEATFLMESGYQDYDLAVDLLVDQKPSSKMCSMMLAVLLDKIPLYPVLYFSFLSDFKS